MATLENSTHPKALANMAKHLAFTRCGEFNLNGMVDAQIALVESEQSKRSICESLMGNTESLIAADNPHSSQLSTQQGFGAS